MNGLRHLRVEKGLLDVERAQVGAKCSRERVEDSEGGTVGNRCIKLLRIVVEILPLKGAIGDDPRLDAAAFLHGEAEDER